MYLYIIEGAKNEYKIGVSANPTKRLKQLQTGSSCELHLRKLILCKSEKEAKKLEARIHRMLWESRIKHKGEWFRLSQESLDFIDDFVKTIKSP